MKRRINKDNSMAHEGSVTAAWQAKNMASEHENEISDGSGRESISASSGINQEESAREINNYPLLHARLSAGGVCALRISRRAALRSMNIICTGIAENSNRTGS